MKKALLASEYIEHVVVTDQHAPVLFVQKKFNEVTIIGLSASAEPKDQKKVGLGSQQYLTFELPEGCDLHKSVGFTYGKKDKTLDGLCALISLKDNHYIFAGRDDIVVFKARAPIAYFYCDRNNGGAEYAGAIDEKGDYYVLWDTQMIAAKATKSKKMSTRQMIDTFEQAVFDDKVSKSKMDVVAKVPVTMPDAMQKLSKFLEKLL